MTTEFVRLDPAWTVGECLKHVRAVAREKESIYACYVMEPDTGRLLGSVSLRDLVMAELDQPVEKVMRRKPVTVNALDDQEAVAGKIAKYNLLAVPVLEKDGSVVGFVTVDDVVDVMIEEGTEDALKMGAVEAGRHRTSPTSTTPFWTLVRKRRGLAARAVPGRDAHRHRHGPLRGGDRPRGGPRPLRAPHHLERRQLRLAGRVAHHPRPGAWASSASGTGGASCGARSPRASCSAASSASWASCASRPGRSSRPQTYGPHWPLVAVTVWVSLIGVVLWGTLAGSMLPLLLKRVGMDPAVSSAPFVATLVDVTGIVIYFEVAARILRGTLL